MDKRLNESIARQRKRVPISCLNCKKRKVKCDKVKPACGGCMKNGVSHLCQYVEPEWARKAMKKEVEHPIPIYGGKSIEETQEYQRLRAEKDNVIYTQSKQLQSLKRELAEYENAEKGSHKRPRNEQRLTVLKKLQPVSRGSKGVFDIEDDEAFTIRRERTALSYTTDVYSWISVIKLDPQLTMMWYRITGLQQIYHKYKINLANRSLLGGGKKESPESDAKRSDFKINEIDFTHSFSSSSNVSLLSVSKCPVVQCDFNFMNDGPTSVSLLKGNVESNERPSSCPYRKSKKMGGISSKIFSYAQLTQRLQDLWDSVLELGKSNEKMTSQQLTFLLESYFEMKVISPLATGTLVFYKDKITKIYKSVANNLFFSLSYNSNGIMDEDYNGRRLCTSGVYLCMLATIIEETLEYFRAQLKSGFKDSNNATFSKLFPSEVACLRLPFPPSNVVNLISEILISIDALFRIKFPPTLSFITCCISSMYHVIDYVEKYGMNGEVKEKFTSLFEIFLSVVMDEGSPMEIWRFLDEEGKDTDKENFFIRLNVNMAYLWNQVIHLFNICSMKITPLFMMTEEISLRMENFYASLNEEFLRARHMKFLGTLSKAEHSGLKECLPKQNFIACVQKQLITSIKGSDQKIISAANVHSLKESCHIWSNDISKSIADPKSEFEDVFLFGYMEIFFSYMLMLQSEEDQSESSVLITKIATALRDCSQYIVRLQNAIIETNKKTESQYILLAATELLTKLIQIIVGLLLKIRLGKVVKLEDQLYSKLINLFEDLPERVNDVEGIVKETIIDKIEESIKLLNNGSLKDITRSAKLQKLWNFYMTLLNNLSKSNAVSYASLHSNIPVFRCEDVSNAQECPIPLSSRTQLMSSAGKDKDFTRCPVSQLTSPADKKENILHENRTSKCPVNHTGVSVPRTLFDGGGEVVFEHDRTKMNKDPTIPLFSVHGNSLTPKQKTSGRNDTSMSKCPFHNNNQIADEKPMGDLPRHDLVQPVSNQPHQPFDFVKGNISPSTDSKASVRPVFNNFDSVSGPAQVEESPFARPNVHIDYMNGLDFQSLDDFANYDLDFLRQENFLEHINGFEGVNGLNSSDVYKDLDSNSL